MVGTLPLFLLLSLVFATIEYCALRSTSLILSNVDFFITRTVHDLVIITSLCLIFVFWDYSVVHGSCFYEIWHFSLLRDLLIGILRLSTSVAMRLEVLVKLLGHLFAIGNFF